MILYKTYYIVLDSDFAKFRNVKCVMQNFLIKIVFFIIELVN